MLNLILNKNIFRILFLNSYWICLVSCLPPSSSRVLPSGSSSSNVSGGITPSGANFQTTNSGFTVDDQTYSGTYSTTGSQNYISSGTGSATCISPSVFVNGTCYSSYSMITNSVDCSAAGAVWQNVAVNGISCFANSNQVSSTGTATTINPIILGNKTPPPPSYPKFTCPAGQTCLPSFGSSPTISVHDPDMSTSPFTKWGPPQWTFVADMDGDGYPDIVTVNASTGFIYILFNQVGKGFGVAKYPFTASSWGTVDEISTIPIVSGTNNASIITYSSSTHTAYVYSLSADFSTLNMQTWALNTNVGTGNPNPDARTWFGNFDGSGPGMASFNTTTGQAFMSFFNNGNPTTATWTFPKNLVTGTNDQYAFAADFNGDGKTEVYICPFASPGSGGVNCPLFTSFAASQQFTAKQCYVAWGDAGFIRIADFSAHGNGQLDILSPYNQYMNLNTFASASDCFNRIINVSTNTATNNKWGTATETFAGQFTGDGKASLVSITSTNMNWYGNISSNSLTYKAMIFPKGFYLGKSIGGVTYGKYNRFINPPGSTPRGASEVQRGYMFAFDYFQNGVTAILSINPDAGTIALIGTKACTNSGVCSAP